MTLYDYPLKFPVSGLTQALAALAALRSAGIISGGVALPENMLGDPRDASGAICAPAVATWIGRPGVAAITALNPVTGNMDTAPARGDPAYYYVHIRSTVPPASIPFDPATYGLMPTPAAEGAAVLGVWA